MVNLLKRCAAILMAACMAITWMPILGGELGFGDGSKVYADAPLVTLTAGEDAVGTLPDENGSTSGSSVRYIYEASSKTLTLTSFGPKFTGHICERYSYSKHPFSDYSEDIIDHIVISDTIDNIPGNVFVNCYHIQSFTIGKGVKSWQYTDGENPFETCSKKFIIDVDAENPYLWFENGGLFLNDNGKKVLVQYMVPYGVTEYMVPADTNAIGAYAFYGQELGTLTLQGSQLDVLACALMSCTIHHLTLKEGVRSITWNNHGGLDDTSVDIPASLTDLYIGGVLYGGSGNNIEAVNVSPANPVYMSIDGVMYSKDGKTLLFYPALKAGTDVVIRNGVETVGEHAISYNPNIQSLVLPASMKLLKYSALNELENLTSLTVLGADCRFEDKWTMYTYKQGVRNILPALTDVYGYDGSDAEAFAAYHGYTFHPMIQSLMLSNSTYTYDGKVKKPSVTVKDGNGVVLARDSDYTVSYASGRKAIGSYRVTADGIGSYCGSIVANFKIVPKKVSIRTPVAGRKKVTVKWSKVSGGVKYQVAYKKKGTSSYKYVTTSSNYKTIKNLKSKKYYYVKVRAYKKVDGSTYYGAWSATKKVKIK